MYSLGDRGLLKKKKRKIPSQALLTHNSLKSGTNRTCNRVVLYKNFCYHSFYMTRISGLQSHFKWMWATLELHFCFTFGIPRQKTMQISKWGISFFTQCCNKVSSYPSNPGNLKYWRVVSHRSPWMSTENQLNVQLNRGHCSQNHFNTWLYFPKLMHSCSVTSTQFVIFRRNRLPKTVSSSSIFLHQ